jgi:hypothetical protein
MGGVILGAFVAIAVLCLGGACNAQDVVQCTIGAIDGSARTFSATPSECYNRAFKNIKSDGDYAQAHHLVGCTIAGANSIHRWWTTKEDCDAQVAAAVSTNNKQAAEARNEDANRMPLVSKTTQQAIRSFCSSSTQVACAYYTGAAYNCQSQSENAYLAFNNYQSLRAQGVPTNIIINQTSNIATGPFWQPQVTVTNARDWTILASQAPPGTTAIRFQMQALQACLDHASH